jgi:hypothetical protein
MLPWPRPGHCPATVAVGGRVFTQAHEHLTEYLPPSGAAVARRGGIWAHHGLDVNYRSATATPIEPCMSAACGSWAARLGFLVGHPRPAQVPKACPCLPARYPITHHALTYSRCTTLDCSQSPEDAAIPVLRHALAQEYWHPSGAKGHRLRSSHLRDQSAS